MHSDSQLFKEYTGCVYLHLSQICVLLGVLLLYADHVLSAE